MALTVIASLTAGKASPAWRPPDVSKAIPHVSVKLAETCDQQIDHVVQTPGRPQPIQDRGRRCVRDQVTGVADTIGKIGNWNFWMRKLPESTA